MSSLMHPWLGEARLILRTLLATATVAAKRQLRLAIRPEPLPRLLRGRECLQLFAGARGLPELPQATPDLADALALTSCVGAAIVMAQRRHSRAFAQHHATRTIVMIDGDLRRQWRRDELDALNADPAQSLEQAMAEALS